jgi:penicillin-binding protein 1C
MTSWGKPLLFNASAGSQAVYDAKGGLLRLSLSSDEKFRLWTPLPEVSPYLIKATLLYEDRSFFEHSGVDLSALVRAFVRTYLLRTSRMGGSTISMQLARLRFALNSKTPVGKLEQILRALQLEFYFTKEQILEAYFNLAPYGENIEGIGAASRIYFGKKPQDLSLQEALSLAVVPQNPNRRKPTARGALPSEARARLAASWRRAYPEESAQGQDLDLPLVASERRTLPFRAPHFVEHVLQRVDAANVSTTLDPELQEMSERALRSFVESRKNLGIQNASLLLIDWRTMAILGYVGSSDFHDSRIEGQVDGTKGRRSPGSALKPFVYAMAMDEGIIHPRSILKDTPASFAAYDPENFDKEFLGPISATYALVRSRNLPAVQIANQLQGDGFYRFLKQARIGALREKDFYGLSLTLGGAEVSLQELVQLYAMLAQGGELRPLTFTPNKQGVPQDPSKIRLLSPEASFLTLSMLSRNPRPSEANVEDENRPFPVAWKTGTSFGFRDAWAVGVFGEYVLGVWVGNFDGRANPAFVGRESAGELFFSLMDAIKLQRGVSASWANPHRLHLKKEKVCSVSGQLPGPFCKHLTDTWFIPGKSPIATCAVHREVLVDDQSGLRACEERPGTHREVFEFWPSDLLTLFRQAGLPRKVPPSFSPECKGGESFGVRPDIVSPQRGIVYQLRLAHLSQSKEGETLELTTDEPIPLKAVADADTQFLFWFVDSALVGKARPGEAVFWKPGPGTFIVRVVDDQGRSDSREVKVEVNQ